jgi:hypothetical protein
MQDQLGKPIPSPVVLGQISEKFREAVKGGRHLRPDQLHAHGNAPVAIEFEAGLLASTRGEIDPQFHR